jgi:hypothetical protein
MMTPRRRRNFHLIVGAFAVSDAIRRIFHLIFGRPQPIEWWLLGADLAIVFLIIWLDVPDKLHKRKLRKIVPSLIPYMDEGRKVEEAIQGFDMRLPKGQEAAYDWTIKADEWGRKTGEFLALHSARASAVFLLVVSSKGAEKHVFSPRHGMQYLSGRTADCYQTLLCRLDNLRRIIEKPEAYF